MSSIHGMSSSSSVNYRESDFPKFLAEPDPRVLGIVERNLKECPSIKRDFFVRLKEASTNLKRAIEAESKIEQWGTEDPERIGSFYWQNKLFQVGSEFLQWKDKELLEFISPEDLENLRTSCIASNDHFPDYEEFVGRGISKKEVHEPPPPYSSCNSPSVVYNPFMDPKLLPSELHPLYLKFIQEHVKGILEQFPYTEQLQICKEVQAWNIQDPFGPDGKTRFNLNARVMYMCDIKAKKKSQAQSRPGVSSRYHGL